MSDALSIRLLKTKLKENQFRRAKGPIVNKRVFERWKTYASYGHADSLYKLGICFRQGIYVIQDNNRADNLFWFSAKQGSLLAQYLIKYSYLLGAGISIEKYLLVEKIYATYEMNSIRYILQYPSWDLAVFDVDQNLITTCDPFYYKHVLPETALHQKWKAIAEISGKDYFHRFVAHTFPWASLEPHIPQIIADIEANNTKVIALTALNPVINDKLEINTVEWRVNHLKDLGYDFF